MKYLLDTHTCVALIRRKPKPMLEKLATLDPGDVGISTITLAELFYGVSKSAHPEQNQAALEQFLLSLEIIDFDERSALAYGNIRAEAERTGKVSGSMDMLIAAQALGLGVILVTYNTREFKRVSGLLLEDWISETKK